MKEEILGFLKKQKGYVSGQDICDKLGVSRTAIWKYMNILRSEGYEIESVTRKGYRLLRSPDIITKEELLRYMPEQLLPGELCYYDTIDSTNEEAKRAAFAGAPDGSLFVADRQTAGKGRRGRSWISPEGEDLFFSLLFRPELPTECASMLTLVAALSAAAMAEKYSGETCQIKWPNDIVLHDRKICGILTEMGVEMGEISYVVIGVGFNINRREMDDEIASMATSIYRETGKETVRAQFLSDFLEDFMQRYHRFLKERTLKSFVEEYNAHLINTGRKVRLVREGKELIRTARGINDTGELIVEDETGKEEVVFSGEVSVRGLYGYV